MMKSVCIKSVLGVLGFAIASSSTDGWAQALTWDANPATPGAQSGNGNWLGGNFWLNGATNQVWADGASATFGGTTGAVMLNGAVSVNGLAVSGTDYTIDGPGPLTLLSPTVDVANAVGDAFAQVRVPILGSSGLRKTGTGSLFLNGTGVNTFTGTTFVDNGTLGLQKSGANAINGDLVVGDGIGAAVTAAVVQTMPNQIPDTAKVTVNADASWTCQSQLETIGMLELNGGTTHFEPAGVLTLSSVKTNANAANAFLRGRVNLGGTVRIFDVADGAALSDLSMYPVQVGTDGVFNGGINKIGAGTLELDGANTFTTLQINGGKVSVADIANAGIASPIGAGTSFSLDGGTLSVTAPTAKATNRAITLGPGGGAFESGSSLTLTGVISGSGGLTKPAIFSINLTGTNTFTGPVSVLSGAITVPTVTNSGVPGPLGAGSTINLDNGGIVVTGGGTHSTNRNIVLGIRLGQVHATVGTVNLTGTLSGPGGPVITGNGGMVVMSGNNTFLGDAFISNGPITLRTAGGNAIPDNSGVTIQAGAVFDINGTTEVIGSLSDPTLINPGGSVTLGAGTLRVGQNSRSTTFSGVISGAGGTLVKEGLGVLTLKGASSFTGPFSIFGGTIKVPDVSDSGVAGPLGAGNSINFGQFATLEYTGGVNDSTNRAITLADPGGARLMQSGDPANLNFAGTISGPGQLITAGFIELTGTNTFTGAITVESVILSVPSVANSGVASPIGAGTDILITNGAGLFLEGFGTSSTNRRVFVSGGASLSPGNGVVTFSGPISGTGGINLTGPGVVELSGTNTFTGSVSVFNSTLRIAGGNAIPDNADVLLAEFSTPAGFQVNNSNETIGSLAGGSATSGATSLGNGTLTIGANNNSTSFDGVISGVGGKIVKVGSGDLTLTRANTFSGSMTIQSGSVLVPDVTDAGIASPIGIGTTLVLGGTGSQGTLVFTGASNDSMVRNIVLNGGGGTIAVSNPSVALTIAAGISGTGMLGIPGPGVVILNALNSYSGPTVIGSGVLRQAGGSQFSEASAVILSNSPASMLDLNNVNASIGSLAGGGSAGGTVLLGTTTLGVGADGTSTTFGGTLTGSATGQLVKVGTGTLTLTGTNTYTGVTGVSAGILRFSGGNAIANASVLFVDLNGTAEFVNGTETVASLLGSGSVKLTGGNMSVGADGFGTTFTGVISGTGNLTKIGGGTLTLTASPTYIGTTTLNAGKLVLDGGFDAAGGGITLVTGSSLNARGAVSRSIAGSGGTITATGTLIIGNSNSTSGFNFGGVLAVGTRQVIIADADIADMSFATLDSGGQISSLNGIRIPADGGVNMVQTVSATIGGTLINNASITGPAAAGQSLSLTGDVSGTGSYGGHVRFTNSFSPGASAAAVSLTNFTFAATNALNLEIGGLAAGTQHDRLNFIGTGTLGGNLVVTFINGFTPAEGNSFVLINGGTLTGTFGSFNLPPLNPALAWQYSQTAGSATLVVIPEPSVATLLLSASLLLPIRRRRA